VKHLISLYLFFISLSAYSLTFTQINKDIILSDDNACIQFDQVITALKEWSQSLEKKECNISILSRTDEKCEAKIKNCLPEKIEQVVGLTPSRAGPNCHNFAFLSSGTSCSVRHVNYKEAVNIYDSALCKILTDLESPRPGDIGRIGSSMMTAHSFIFLTDEQMLSKNGEMSSKYNIFNSEKIINAYGVSKNEACKSVKYRKSKQCTDGISYYRCISIDDYINSKSTSKEYSAAYQSIKALNSIAECRSLYGKSIDPHEVSGVVADSLIILNKYLDDEINKILLSTQSTKEEIFLMSTLLDQISSLEDYASQFDPQNGFFIADFSESNIDPVTGLDINKKLSGNWRNELRKKYEKLNRKKKKTENPGSWGLGF
jgi:hypothetical protein